MQNDNNPFEELEKELYLVEVLGLARGAGDPDVYGYPGEYDESKAD